MTPPLVCGAGREGGEVRMGEPGLTRVRRSWSLRRPYLMAKSTIPYDNAANFARSLIHGYMRRHRQNLQRQGKPAEEEV